jgi:hypothetical protein
MNKNIENGEHAHAIRNAYIMLCEIAKKLKLPLGPQKLTSLLGAHITKDQETQLEIIQSTSKRLELHCQKSETNREWLYIVAHVDNRKTETNRLHSKPRPLLQALQHFASSLISEKIYEIEFE